MPLIKRRLNPTLADLQAILADAVTDSEGRILDDDAADIVSLLTGIDEGYDQLTRLFTFGQIKAHQGKDDEGKEIICIPGIIDFGKTDMTEVRTVLVEMSKARRWCDKLSNDDSILKSNIGQAQIWLGRELRNRDDFENKFKYEGHNLTFKVEDTLRPNFPAKEDLFLFLQTINQGDIIQPQAPWQTVEAIVGAMRDELPMVELDEEGHTDVSHIPETTKYEVPNPTTGELVVEERPSYFFIHKGGPSYELAVRMGRGYRTVASMYQTHIAKLTSRKY